MQYITYVTSKIARQPFSPVMYAVEVIEFKSEAIFDLRDCLSNPSGEGEGDDVEEL